MLVLWWSGVARTGVGVMNEMMAHAVVVEGDKQVVADVDGRR